MVNITYITGTDLGFCKGGRLPLYGERGSASLFRGLGAVPPEGFRGKAFGGGGGGLGGQSSRKLTHIFYWKEPRL